ncbi:MAG: BglG family transcription antiterminator [Eubacteriales bacterium]
MDSRTKQLLKVMLAQESPISVVKLAEQLEISKRTVQRELEGLPTLLKKYDLTFASKTGVGVWIEGEGREKLLEELNQDEEINVSHRTYRRKRLILLLLTESGVQKLYWFASEFKVSEATISADLESLDDWFTALHLKICRKLGTGIWLEGSEESRRRAIRAFIRENMHSQLIEEAYHDELEEIPFYSQLKQVGIPQILNKDVIKRVFSALEGMEHPQITTLTQSSYQGLVIHLSISVNRMLQGEHILQEQTFPLPQDQDYELAEKIAVELEEEFEFTVPKGEIAYICLHIKGSKQEKISKDVEKTLQFQGRDLKNLMDEMIYAFDPEKAFHLKQDEEFLHGLIAHLQPTLVRLTYQMEIHNPILPEIKENYLDIFTKCQKVAEVMEKTLGKTIPEGEIGFITLHFGAALVRLEEKSVQRRTVNVGLVCSSGIGISHMMYSKLVKIFKDRISLTSYGKRELVSSVYEREDFLVSAVSLKNCGIPVVEVSPLLSDADIEKIRKTLKEWEHTERKKKISPSRQSELEEFFEISGLMKGILDRFAISRLPKEIPLENTISLIADHCATNPTCAKLISTDLWEREKLSTQIFPEMGFALLHGKTEGVYEPQLRLYLTEELTPFAHPSLRGISVIIVMLLPKEEKPITAQILGSISTAIIDDDTILTTLASGENEQVVRAISSVFKEFLVGYLQT